ncbi:glycyl-tRNA synthetase [Allocatelliglobosispora scoriae]|uniref:Multifunctional fusion protein n=1 Tax=Allocatelliglobosispora scoriae TaxID=643052 RepID=A0A841C662_9ACTN|nr:glycine--tRNA ligase [Allocatelliglobosispora scoriae]MBB5874633.1 glycyl-tRNA synthetase [Allocatelliglobosispora scoriae]
MTDLTMQDALSRLSAYWGGLGCLTVQPMNTEVGAGTLNPATALRVLGPEPWKVAYVEPSVRPDDARYGQNPNRIQCHTQFQVILKPDPGNPQELYLGSLVALGVDITKHDVRFVEDNWASPALGAWGLGWEVWLDGLEITQFTYFQQAGGITLNPVSVEITYGMERILMALQGVRHFKDIEYAPGISYGEVFGQTEYEMSRYYLDDADVPTNRELLSAYAAEAQRMIDAGLPIPAHSFVLKMSHAFNVLDARGAVSTADRTNEFARMRRLSNAVAKLWIATREKEGFPLGQVAPPPMTATTWCEQPEQVGPQLLVFEIGVEEMPPAEARDARQQIETALTTRLEAGRLTYGTVQVRATPRRIAAIVTDVSDRETDAVTTVRGPRASAAFKDGMPTAAALGFARSNGVSPDDLATVTADGVAYVCVQREEPGRPAVDALVEALSIVVGGLRSAKNMRWSDPELVFTRPIRWVLAMWGNELVPVTVSRLSPGASTRVHRNADQPSVSVSSANEYLPALAAAGILLDETVRRKVIIDAARAEADKVNGSIDADGEASLLDQITFLVEQPTAILGDFDPRYLGLPDAILTTVMRKHQRYLPVRDGQGQLLPHFVVIANGVIDSATVQAGNEAVLRARFEDAAFFYRADQTIPIATMRERLHRLTFTDKLGSMADRADRIAALAQVLTSGIPLGEREKATLERAAQIVKFDLGSQMVTEMTSLAGVMGREYALYADETTDVGAAIFEAELPRHSGDQLPQSTPGALLALADKLDSLIGLAATVGLPTGSSDPFALRRAAVGTIAIHRGTPALAGLSLRDALAEAARLQPVPVASETIGAVGEFLARRLEQQFLEEGHAVDRVRAVIIHADRPSTADRVLRQLTDLIETPDFRRLAAALQRARRISTTGGPAYNPVTLTEPAEQYLHEAASRTANDLPEHPDLGDLVAAGGDLPAAVDTFFDDILVMADDPEVRARRLALVGAVAALGEGVLDWQALKL